MGEGVPSPAPQYWDVKTARHTKGDTAMSTEKQTVDQKNHDTLKEDLLSRLDQLSPEELRWIYVVVLELTRHT